MKTPMEREWTRLFKRPLILHPAIYSPAQRMAALDSLPGDSPAWAFGPPGDERMEVLRGKGFSLRRIAAECGVSKDAVRRRLG